jgi:hypothetical protein
MSPATDLSPKTIAGYLARSDRLRKACARALDVDIGSLAWRSLASWMWDKKSGWCSSTWNTYKSSVRYALRQAGEDRPDDADVKAATATLKQETEGSDKSSPQRTSATKAKKFPAADRLRVYAELTFSRSDRARELTDFLRAACATGLRPIEWRNATLVTPDDGFCVQLVVVNAKPGHDRTHGPIRTLRWRNLPIVTQRAIVRTIEIARSFASDDEYEAYRKHIQELLRKVSLRLWPERKSHFTLYSCRHAAIAAAKVIYSRAEVAALFGHATDDSCMSGYPRKQTKKKSKGGLDAATLLEIPVPDPDEVARVRRRADVKLARLETLADGVTPSEAPLAPTTAIASKSRKEPTLDPFPEPPRKNAALEEARKREGSTLWRGHSEKRKAEFDELDRSIDKTRDRASDQEPQNPRASRRTKKNFPP